MEQINALLRKHELELEGGFADLPQAPLDSKVSHWRIVPDQGTYPIVDVQGYFRPSLPTVLQQLQKVLATERVVKVSGGLVWMVIDRSSDLAPSTEPPLVKVRLHFFLTLSSDRIIIIKAGAIGPTEESVLAFLDEKVIVDGAATANQSQQAVLQDLRDEYRFTKEVPMNQV